MTRPMTRSLLRAVAITATAVAVLLPTAAHAAVPTSPVRLPAAIEGFAKYQGQTTCSPSAKPGTTKLKNMLLKTYAGTRSLGISRSCAAGGRSEHKEGRAFDWGVKAWVPSEKKKADAFVAWLLKTDSRGHKAANARRLGVMYVIWNKRIWGAYAAHSGWRTYNGGNPHRDHVHISLSRAGGAGTTSFWTGRVNGTSTTPVSGTADAEGGISRPTPVVKPIVQAPRPAATLPTGAPLADETVVVRPTRTGVGTLTALVKGQRYRIEARGTWKWNRKPGSTADAECSTVEGSGWRSERVFAQAAGDQLGLYLDGRDLPLRSYSGSSCSHESHTYVTSYVAPRTGRVPLKLWEPAPATSYADNSGAVRVRIIHDTPRDTLGVAVDLRDYRGTTTPGSVVAGQRYTITATGTWSPTPGTTGDAVCLDTAQGQVAPRDPDGHRIWKLYVDDHRLRADCRPDHVYRWSFVAERSGPVVVRLDDDETYANNSGALHVTLDRVPLQ